MQLDFSREHDDEDIEQIDKEIEAWELVFADGKVMRSHYDSEKELEDDWYKYMSQCYEHKCIANNMAYRLYGMKNEDVYKKFKHHFLTTTDAIQQQVDDIDEYIPSQRLYESSSFKDQEAEDVYNSTGYYVITDKNDSSDDLIQQLYRFKSMSRDKQAKSNDYSTQIYGKSNEERYNEMMPKLLSSEPIEYDEISISYGPSTSHTMQLSESYNPSTINKYEKTREYIKNKSIAESILIVEAVTESTKPHTPLEKKLYTNLLEAVKTKIHESMEENFIGYKSPYFLPSEIIRLTNGQNPSTRDSFSNQWLVDYQSKLMGFKPRQPIVSMEWRYRVNKAIETGQDNTVISLGWNPSIPFTEEALIQAAKRINRIMRENMGYTFVDLSDMTPNLPLSEDAIPSGKAVYLVFNKDESSQNPNIPGALMAFNANLAPAYAIVRDETNRVALGVNTGINRFGMISVYAIRLPQDISFNVGQITSTFRSSSTNYIKASNESSFVTNAFNNIIFYAKTFQDRKLIQWSSMENLRGQSKDFIYKVYQGKSTMYQPQQVNTLLSQKLKSNITEDHQLYPFLNVVPIRDLLNNPDPHLDKDAHQFLREHERKPIDYSTANELLNEDLFAKIDQGSYTKGYIINNILKRKFVSEQLDPIHVGLNEHVSKLYDWARTHVSSDLDSIYNESPYRRMVLKIPS